MDCRVKPGNDKAEGKANYAAAPAIFSAKA